MSASAHSLRAAGGVSGGARGTTINTGALLANVQKTLIHNFNLANYQLEVSNNVNNVAVNVLRKDAGDPANKINIQVGVNLPGGLDVSIIGY